MLVISNRPRTVLINRIKDKFRDQKSFLKLPLSEKVSGVLACSWLLVKWRRPKKRAGD